jgi:hypothetical protein
MKKFIKIFTISMVIAGITAAILASTVFAGGPQSRGEGTGQIGVSTTDAVCEILGLTPEQIQEQREAGQSLVQIAAAQNVSEDDLINAILEEKRTALQEQVAAGTITQEQADLRLAQMQERIRLAVNRTTIGAPEWAGNAGNGQNGAYGGNGEMRQGGPGVNQENCTGTPGTGTGTGNMFRGSGNGR